MAMQMPAGMPGMPAGAQQAWPGASMPMQCMPANCSAPIIQSIPADHSMPGSAFPMTGRGEPAWLAHCHLEATLKEELVIMWP
jgi:hypothetical protein